MAGRRPLGRRAFILIGATAGGGLLVGVRLFGPREQSQPSSITPSQGGPDASEGPVRSELHAFVEISTSGVVTVTAPCPEVGQGVRTALAQIVVEELDVPWQGVSVRQGEANSRYGPQAVGGSDSVRDYWTPLRRAGATARAVLVEQAAADWDVPAAECTTDQGAVLHVGSGRRLPYGELAAGAAERRAPGPIDLRDPEEFRLIGTSPDGVDVAAIVSGRAGYGMDVRVPGMLRAVVARSPVHGGVVSDFDDTEALALPGVRRVVPLPATVPSGDLYGAVRSGVAVVADDTWSAMRGRDALDVRWAEGGNASESSDAVRERLRAAVTSAPTHVIREEGDVDAAFEAAARVVEGTYELPMIAHACMEPMNSTAHATRDRCDVWGPVQVPQRLRQAVAAALDVSVSAVHVHPTLAGGGFGRRLAVDYGVEAALLSREVEAPVQVVWTREDDLRFDYFRPPSAHRLRAALDERGAITAWEHQLATPSLLANIESATSGTHPAIYDVQGAADVPFATPALRVAYTAVPVAAQMGSWRSVAHSFNTFAVASFVDELAAETGRDPLEVNLELLGSPRVAEISLPLPGRRGQPRPDVSRIRHVLSTAAAQADWGASLPADWGRGLAWAEYKGSYAAQVAEVQVSPDGSVRVRRVVCVLDCGRAINPSGIRRQMEGAVIDGVSTVLHWSIGIREGRVVESNFHDYRLARMDEAPLIESHVVTSGEPPAGAGEPPYPSVAPAIANAVFNASGTRIRELPIRRA